MELSRYLKIYPSPNNSCNVILYSTKNAAIVELPKRMAERLPGCDLSPEDRRTLRGAGFLVKDREKERRELLGFIDELNGLNTSLSIKLVMNLDCNLACRYCFEGKRKGRHYMTRETTDEFVEFVKARITSPAPSLVRRGESGSRVMRIPPLARGGKGGVGPIKEILITFYGGEPLLSRELVIYVSERLKPLAKDRGLRLKLYLITNGTLLTKQTVKMLKPLGLKEACVTLDGPSEIHNAFRPFKDGGGSFAVILSNIRDVHRQVRIMLNGNFTRENYRRFPALLDRLGAEGIDIARLKSAQFSPVVSETADFGPAGFHEGCASINEPWYPKATVWLREEILRRGGRQGRTEPGLCMMEHRNNFLVNYNGDIFKCPGFIGRKEFCVGNIRTGISDYRTSHNLDNWKNDECLDCAYLPLCFGGCRYMKYVRDGNMDGVDCRKPYFDATLEAFVKQDIRYGVTG